MLVGFIKNANRALQPANRSVILGVALDLLELRQGRLRKSRGRSGVPLSNAAKNVLEKKSLGDTFWGRFEAAHAKE